jgi:crotonobetainyl-CoA:carnitine CoA-transferase CaiB-like acyl-CoA transferase
VSEQPLAGLRVLELARILAGPWCCQILADLGADVVKVESPEGDDTRKWGPPFVEGREGKHLDAAYYHSCNRGKRGVVADFRDPQQVAWVVKLARHADVLVENFKLGGLRKFGLDEAKLRAANPRLIYCSITGFGQTGPYAHRPGYDFIIQGMGGIMSVTGEADGLPQKSGVAIADIFTGTNAAIAILAALHRRRETGAGAFIDMSLLDTQVGFLQAQALNYLVGGKTPVRMGNQHPNLAPYAVVVVADGHMILATGNDAQFARTCAVLGAPEMATDPRFRANSDRLANRDVLMALINGRTATFAKADLLAKLEAAGVPAGPINTVPEVFADPQVIHRAMKRDLAAPEAAAGTIPAVRSPYVIDGAAQCAPRPSPGLGQHQAEVKADRGWGGA